MINKNVIVIGICGCSRCGKTKLTKELIQQYEDIPKSNSQFCNISTSIHLDKYFNIEKITKNKIKTTQGHIYRNWEFPGALNWDDFYLKIKNTIKEMNEVIKNNFTPDKKGILVIEGFLLFSPEFEKYKNEVNDYLNIFDYYIYICLDKNIAKERRMKTTKVANDYYDEILWPEHIKYCNKYIDFFKYLKENNKNILIIDGNKEFDIKQMALCILKWINALNSSFSTDIKYEDIYGKLFTSFGEQTNLLEKHFSHI